MMRRAGWSVSSMCWEWIQALLKWAQLWPFSSCAPQLGDLVEGLVMVTHTSGSPDPLFVGLVSLSHPWSIFSVGFVRLFLGL